MYRYGLLLLALFSVNSNAVETPTPFKIDSIYMSDPNNFHFRVESNSGGWHCHNGPKSPAWSYINENDPGAKGMMSALLTAFAAGYTVKLHTVGVDTTAGRQCRIVEFRIVK
ncbi:hypothetical protein [Vibrio nigripulchritudo]|uniref:hypothetical protein n=1 Tax=Vibrio nigripulchritudo TaxID=28173 RepID=UPI0024928D9C|nr:hypothetical protein [Vibrio nigripulchritudo]